MTQPMEYDWPPTMRVRRGRRRRPSPILEGEILTPELEHEPPPRIHRVEVVHRAYQPRQRQHVPPWVIALLIMAVLMWISPFGTVVALVMLGILVSAHPTFAATLLAALALVIIIAMRERWHGRPF
jgi:hypothetical protein